MEAEYLQYWEGEKNPENDANLNIAFIGASSLKNKSEINNNFYVNIPYQHFQVVETIQQLQNFISRELSVKTETKNSKSKSVKQKFDCLLQIMETREIKTNGTNLLRRNSIKPKRTKWRCMPVQR